VKPPVASRYLIGIDLGTTNSVAAYIDTYCESQESTFLLGRPFHPSPIEDYDSSGKAVMTNLEGFGILANLADYRRLSSDRPANSGTHEERPAL
jgi:hypothetical protein